MEYNIVLIETQEYKHMEVMRSDGKPINGWDQLQEIKTIILGDVEAVEVYPRSGDVVNHVNARHLFAPKVSMWFGIDERFENVDVLNTKEICLNL